MAVWLFACCALVFAIVDVGGITRLTHSGLSIVEWQPLVGTVPPLDDAQWQETFRKYQATPEFRLVNRDMTLEQIVKESAGKEPKIFNNAAQAWNHTFYWNCLKKGGGKPSGAIASRIDSDCGGYDEFRKKFAETAVNCFGSGWAWLVEKDGKLDIVATSNAATPIAQVQTPILTLDVWEHAYYLDYQNRRPDYAAAVIEKLLNWDFAAEQLEKAKQRKAA